MLLFFKDHNGGAVLVLTPTSFKCSLSLRSPHQTLYAPLLSPVVATGVALPLDCVAT
jgi:hypothetical protein